MLSLQQKLILRSAISGNPENSKERLEAIDKAVRLVQMMTPNLFYPNPPHTQPTREMKERVFFDEPTKLPEANYKSYVVPYVEHEQVKKFKRRDNKYYPGSENK